MVDKAKRTTAIARKGPEKEIYSANAAEVRPAPSSSCPLTITADEPSTRFPYVNKLLSPLNIIITKAVIVQITTVSINGSRSATNPSEAG